jgi:hypothetical protein
MTEELLSQSYDQKTEKVPQHLKGWKVFWLPDSHQQVEIQPSTNLVRMEYRRALRKTFISYAPKNGPLVHMNLGATRVDLYPSGGVVQVDQYNSDGTFYVAIDTHNEYFHENLFTETVYGYVNKPSEKAIFRKIRDPLAPMLLWELKRMNPEEVEEYFSLRLKPSTSRDFMRSLQFKNPF